MTAHRFRFPLALASVVVGGAAGASVEYISAWWVGVPVGAAGAAITWLVGVRLAEAAARRELRDAWRVALDEEPGVPASTGSIVSRLDPVREAVAFDHRRDEFLVEIEAWLAEGDTRVWRVEGGPGSGKTRLAVQLARRLRRQGWRVGWLRAGQGSTAVRTIADLGGEPTVIIADDERVGVDDVAALMTALAAAGPAAPVEAAPVEAAPVEAVPVRAVLVTRGSDRWWAAVAEAGSWTADVLADGSTVLGPLGAAEPAQREVALTALRAFAGTTDRPRRVPVTGVADSTPLMLLHCAALVASRQPSARIDVETAAAELFRLEDAEFWQPTADKMIGRGVLPEPVRRAVVVLAALFGAPDRGAAARLLRYVPALRDQSDGTLRRVVGWVRQLYPHGSDDYLHPRLPGWAAEYVTATSIAADPDTAAAVSAAIGDSAQELHEVLSLLGRAAGHLAAARRAFAVIVEGDVPGRLPVAFDVAVRSSPWLDGDLARVIGAAGLSRADLRRAAERLPHRSQAVLDSAVAVLRKLVAAGAGELTAELCRRLGEAGHDDEAIRVGGRRKGLVLLRVGQSRNRVGDHVGALADLRQAMVQLEAREDRPAEYGEAVVELGRCLTALGRHDEALAAFEQASRLCRDPSTAGYGAARTGLGLALAAVGRLEDALEAQEEAVRVCRALATAQPDAYQPDHAAALTNLGVVLGLLGRDERALTVLAEAVSALRALAAAHPRPHGAACAAALAAQGASLSASGRHDAAVAVRSEAVSLWRDLATAQPAAHRPGYAEALTGLAAGLLGAGRIEEAVAASRESVELFRELAAAAPEAHRPAYTVAVHALGRGLLDAGRHEEALAVFEQAADLARELVATYPAAHGPKLAAAIGNIGACLAALGRRDEAPDVLAESVRRWHEVASARPDAHRAGYSAALTNWGFSLREVGRFRDALAADERALALWPDPDADRPAYGLVLLNLGVSLGSVDRHAEALAVFEEAVALWRELASAQPDAYGPYYAKALNSLSTSLRTMGRDEEAWAQDRRAVRLWRDLAARHPDAHEPDYGEALTNLGIALLRLDRADDGREFFEQAVQLWQGMPAARLEAHRPAYGVALTGLGICLWSLGRHTETRAVATRMITVWTALAAAYPDAYQSRYVEAFGYLGEWLGTPDGLDDLRQRAEEAVAAFQQAKGSSAPLAWTWGQLGIVHYRSGRQDDAITAATASRDLFRRLAAEQPDRFADDLQDAERRLVAITEGDPAGVVQEFGERQT